MNDNAHLIVVTDPFLIMIKLSVSPCSAILVVSSKKVLGRAHISRETSPTLVVETPTKTKVEDNSLTKVISKL